MTLLTPKRAYIEEWLDIGMGTDEDVARNLSDLRRFNRFLGGASVVLKALAKTIGEDAKRISLLDVGTGSADIPAAVADWCRSRGITFDIVALDISKRNLRITRSSLGVHPEVKLICADATRLPFAACSFDYVTASLFLHHFHDEEAVRLLADFGHIARRSVIVNDLVRSPVPYYFLKIFGPILTTSFLTRHDGPVSVLRGFTATELKAMAERAGLGHPKVERIFPYRLLLIADAKDQQL
jgi:hypothetical protein